jgi:hypothetical protein
MPVINISLSGDKGMLYESSCIISVLFNAELELSRASNLYISILTQSPTYYQVVLFSRNLFHEFVLVFNEIWISPAVEIRGAAESLPRVWDFWLHYHKSTRFEGILLLVEIIDNHEGRDRICPRAVNPHFSVGPT